MGLLLVACLRLEGLYIFSSNTELMPAHMFSKHGVGSSETSWRFLVVLLDPEARQELEKRMLHRHAMVWERDQPWAVLDFEENPGAVFEFGVNLGAGPVVDLLSSSEMFSLQGEF